MILVTGACGYIGSHCSIQLIRKGYDLILVDNLVNSNISILDKINYLTKKNNKFIECDLRDEDNLKKIFENNSINSVFHFAGLKSIYDSYKNPLEYYSANIASTISLLNQISSNSVNHLIFSSSATVYDETSDPPWNESYRLSLDNSPYAQTKVIIEKILESYVTKNNFLHVGILRYFNPIGSHESGIIGDNIKGSTNLIPAIVETILGKREYLEVYGNDYNTFDGTGIRDYIHIDDLVEGHVKAYEYIRKNRGLNIWNLGSGKGQSVNQIISKFQEFSDIKIPIKIKPRRQGDLAQYWADITKATNQLKWRPKKDLKDMVKSTINYVNKKT